jgi:hypothetical protein|tara:strand:- start:986 stop:1111 length:126 start_codon:yes stop_codon:yes gene_type:complete
MENEDKKNDGGLKHLLIPLALFIGVAVVTFILASWIISLFK